MPSWIEGLQENEKCSDFLQGSFWVTLRWGTGDKTHFHNNLARLRSGRVMQHDWMPVVE